MEITLNIDKSLEENASVYYDQAKKYKKKIEGAIEIVEKTKAKLKKHELSKPKDLKFEVKGTIKREWFEKFRWFYTSEDLLVICGKDATSNEIIIKKHTDKEDVVFHTQMPGSPFCVIKTNGKTPSEDSLREAAEETASYSKAWKLGISFTETFYVSPEQVSKTALSGEFMGKGSFMIYGKKNFITAKIEVAIGVDKFGKVISGPVSAVSAHSDKLVVIIPGKTKTSDLAKIIKKKINGDLDEIARFIPAGGSDLKS